jgi:uncharacterized membrane protein
MAGPQRERKTGQPATARSSAKGRDKGTRGGRPEPVIKQSGPAGAMRPGQAGTGRSGGGAGDGAAAAGRASGNGAATNRGGNGAATNRQSHGNGAARGRSAPRPTAAAAGPMPASGTVLGRMGQWIARHPVQFVSWLLSIAGLGVSIYLTIAHYTTAAILACSDQGIVNCAAVTTSPQSVVFGIFPVADLGLAFYLFMAVVNSPWAWRITWPPLRWIRLGSVVVGIVFVLYLIYTELFTLNAICLWCTSVHVITFLLFGLIVFATTAGHGKAEDRNAG